MYICKFGVILRTYVTAVFGGSLWREDSSMYAQSCLGYALQHVTAAVLSLVCATRATGDEGVLPSAREGGGGGGRRRLCFCYIPEGTYA